MADSTSGAPSERNATSASNHISVPADQQISPRQRKAFPLRFLAGVLAHWQIIASAVLLGGGYEETQNYVKSIRELSNSKYKLTCAPEYQFKQAKLKFVNGVTPAMAGVHADGTALSPEESASAAAEASTSASASASARPSASGSAGSSGKPSVTSSGR